MFRGLRSKSLNPRKVTFDYYAPGAKEVQLAGTFNDWNPSQTSLKSEGEGKWKVSLKLPPGRYEYRFWVDGSWHNDPSNVECVPNPFGTWNCVLVIQ